MSFSKEKSIHMHWFLHLCHKISYPLKRLKGWKYHIIVICIVITLSTPFPCESKILPGNTFLLEGSYVTGFNIFWWSVFYFRIFSLCFTLGDSVDVLFTLTFNISRHICSVIDPCLCPTLFLKVFFVYPCMHVMHPTFLSMLLHLFMWTYEHRITVSKTFSIYFLLHPGKFESDTIGCWVLLHSFR